MTSDDARAMIFYHAARSGLTIGNLAMELDGRELRIYWFPWGMNNKRYFARCFDMMRLNMLTSDIDVQGEGKRIAWELRSQYEREEPRAKK